MTIIEYGSQNTEISSEQLESFVADSIAALGNVRSMIALPPDITRFHSRAGLITDMIARIAGPRLKAVMPALGTHVPMTAEEIHAMYPGTPKGLFRNHDWRNDVTELARLDADFISEVSENTVAYDYPVQANKLLVSSGHDAIISIGQVVPHEVVGMANHAKNIFVGTGGKEAIDKSQKPLPWRGLWHGADDGESRHTGSSCVQQSARIRQPHPAPHSLDIDRGRPR